MTNPIANWWRSLQFCAALKQGNTRLAEQLLHKIHKSGAKLSWLEQLFKNKLVADKSLHACNQEFAGLTSQLKQALERIEELDQKLALKISDGTLLPEIKFINSVSKNFKFIEQDKTLLQCTGIDEGVFNDFEANLVEYLQEEINKIPEVKRALAITEAFEDIDGLKRGLDPQYSFQLTPHVYFMKYFLDNVYCAYLAWFLIYKSGLLPANLNILDIAAGPGTVAYGLALLLRSSSGFFQMPQMHISYYSLEKQAAFQYRGLQFWRRYIEPQQAATNAYFRFDTTDIFAGNEQFKKLPKDFFDFVVVSHCFFSSSEKRNQSQQAYNKIIKNSLKDKGYILLIIQDKKIFKTSNVRQSENRIQEEKVIMNFVEELGLNLVWYKYLTSTGERTPMASGFARFASENLPSQKYMSQLMQQYLGIKYNSHYVLDDYVILAKK